MALKKRVRRAPGVLASLIHVDAAIDESGRFARGGRESCGLFRRALSRDRGGARPAGQPGAAFTLVGGLTGCAAGFGMTIWMSLDWPVLVGGKTIGSIPRYVVIAFELTILLGSLSTLAAVALLSVLMGKRGIAYDPRFSDDQIGVFVPGGGDQLDQWSSSSSGGAVEVRHEAA